MATDKTTIGVTPKSQQVLDKMSENGTFADQMDAAKLAISISVSRGLKPGEITGAGTKWNVGSFDPDNQLRRLIPILFPNIQAPYRAIESLIDSGLAIVAQEYLKGGQFDIAQVLKDIDVKPRK